MADVELDSVVYDEQYDDYDFQCWLGRDKWLKRATKCLSRAFDYEHIAFARRLHEEINQYIQIRREDYEDEKEYEKSKDNYYGVSRYDVL